MFVLLLLDLSQTPSIIILDVFDGVYVPPVKSLQSLDTVYVCHDLPFCSEVLKLVFAEKQTVPVDGFLHLSKVFIPLHFFHFLLSQPYVKLL